MTVITRVRVLTAAAALLAVAGPGVASAQSRQAQQSSPPPAQAAPPPPPPAAAPPPSPPPAVHAAPAPSAPVHQSGGPSTVAVPRGGVMRAESGSSSSGSSGPSRGGSASHPGGQSRGGSTAAVTRGETHGRTGDVRPVGVSSGSVPRSRGDRTAVGTAVDRTGPPHGGHHPGYYPPYYYPPYYYYPYAGFIWDPFWWGYSAGYGYGDPGGYPVYGGGGGGGGGGDVWYGSLKLKVKPGDAQVYVDGYFSGLVDDFDGMFQKLNLEVGVHHIEVRADGYETLALDVRIEFDQTVTYKGELKKLPGDAR
jgi:hypothetical protein